jgi:hypothetical protein
MRGLKKAEKESIVESLNELKEFTEVVATKLKMRKLSQFDISEIETNLRYIESNTSQIIDLLTTDE